ncbi:hypothetical protein SEVIR_7G077751v4 [Setaria viridis]
MPYRWKEPRGLYVRVSEELLGTVWAYGCSACAAGFHLDRQRDQIETVVIRPNNSDAESPKTNFISFETKAVKFHVNGSCNVHTPRLRRRVVSLSAIYLIGCPIQVRVSALLNAVSMPAQAGRAHQEQGFRPASPQRKSPRRCWSIPIPSVRRGGRAWPRPSRRQVASSCSSFSVQGTARELHADAMQWSGPE